MYNLLMLSNSISWLLFDIVLPYKKLCLCVYVCVFVCFMSVHGQFFSAYSTAQRQCHNLIRVKSSFE